MTTTVTLPASRPCEEDRTTPQTSQSARAGYRVLMALSSLGSDREHQVSEIAGATGLRIGHVSKLLRAAVDERLAVDGSRRGAYRLAPQALRLTGLPTTTSTTPAIRQITSRLHDETGLVAAYAEPSWRPGEGASMTLVEMRGPAELADVVAAQHRGPLLRTAPGRATLAHLPPHLAVDAHDRQLRLDPELRASVLRTRIAIARTERAHTMATCLMRGASVAATLSVTGPAHSFADPLQVQEYAVLLRRAASARSLAAA